MSDIAQLLREAETVLLVDWPSREVPDTLAHSGYTVFSEDAPDEYNAYEVVGDEVQVRPVGQPPQRADLVYSHRPIDELAEIAEQAASLGATTVWLQSGLDSSGARDPLGVWLPEDESRRAREIVESKGLVYVEQPYIVDVLRHRD